MKLVARMTRLQLLQVTIMASSSMGILPKVFMSRAFNFVLAELEASSPSSMDEIVY